MSDIDVSLVIEEEEDIDDEIVQDHEDVNYDTGIKLYGARTTKMLMFSSLPKVLDLKSYLRLMSVNWSVLKPFLQQKS